MPLPSRHTLVASCLLALCLLLGFGIWVLLPARYAPIDVAGSALALLCGAAGLSLLLQAPWALSLARIACWTSLLLGTAASSALALVAAHLSGLYGPVGAGGALLLATVALLILPYLVGLPALQLAWLRGEPRAEAAPAPRQGKR